jgi:ABC-type uncharacterized transport system substrate-binding protein
VLAATKPIRGAMTSAKDGGPDSVILFGKQPSDGGRQGCNQHDSNCLHHRGRSGSSRLCYQPARAGGNLTGVASLDTELGRKRLQILHELLPNAGTIAALVNPTFPSSDVQTTDLQAAASALGLRLHVLHASTAADIDMVIANVVRLQASGLVIANDPFFSSWSEQLGALALRHRVPAIYEFHPFVAAGGLMSYGGSITDLYRLLGTYTGRVLKGERPAELPVQQTTKVELIINLKTAKVLGLTVPTALLVRADEVIE